MVFHADQSVRGQLEITMPAIPAATASYSLTTASNRDSSTAASADPAGWSSRHCLHDLSRSASVR